MKSSVLLSFLFALSISCYAQNIEKGDLFLGAEYGIAKAIILDAGGVPAITILNAEVQQTRVKPNFGHFLGLTTEYIILDQVSLKAKLQFVPTGSNYEDQVSGETMAGEFIEESFEINIQNNYLRMPIGIAFNFFDDYGFVDFGGYYGALMHTSSRMSYTRKGEPGMYTHEVIAKRKDKMTKHHDLGLYLGTGFRFLIHDLSIGMNLSHNFGYSTLKGEKELENMNEIPNYFMFNPEARNTYTVLTIAIGLRKKNKN